MSALAYTSTYRPSANVLLTCEKLNNRQNEYSIEPSANRADSFSLEVANVVANLLLIAAKFTALKMSIYCRV